jgi:hypothetical protein
MVWGRHTTAVVECDISRKVDWMSRADCWPPQAPDLTLMDFFLWGHLKEQLHVPSQGYLRSPQKTSGDCDDGQYQHDKV